MLNMVNIAVYCYNYICNLQYRILQASAFIAVVQYVYVTDIIIPKYNVFT